MTPAEELQGWWLEPCIRRVAFVHASKRIPINQHVRSGGGSLSHAAWSSAGLQLGAFCQARWMVESPCGIVACLVTRVAGGTSVFSQWFFLSTTLRVAAHVSCGWERLRLLGLRVRSFCQGGHAWCAGYLLPCLCLNLLVLCQPCGPTHSEVGRAVSRPGPYAQ